MFFFVGARIGTSGEAWGHTKKNSGWEARKSAPGAKTAGVGTTSTGIRFWASIQLGQWVHEIVRAFVKVSP
jgi:hypothetical protein